jgi:hypothetical protein
MHISSIWALRFEMGKGLRIYENRDRSPIPRPEPEPKPDAEPEPELSWLSVKWRSDVFR